MRRLFLALTGSAVVVAMVALGAAETQTITGQVIDLTCYARMGRATGAAYDECAHKNARAGSILGILTSVFSSVVVSRAIVNLVYGHRRKVQRLLIGDTAWK